MRVSLRHWELITEAFCDIQSLSIHKSLSVSLLAQKNAYHYWHIAIISRTHTVYFSHHCISLRERPDLQASTSQSDLVLTAMKTMMNRMNSIKETESVFENEKQDWWTKKKAGNNGWQRHFHVDFQILSQIWDTKAPQNPFQRPLRCLKANTCFNCCI